MRRFLKGLRYFFSGNWIPRFTIEDDEYDRKFVKINGVTKDVSHYTEVTVNGTGIERWNIKDGARLFIRPIDEEEKNNIEKHPIVMIIESGAYWFECDKALKKFCGYIDICPSEKDDVSSEIWKHARDTSTMMLYPDYDCDIDGYSRFYTLNHPSLAGINRMQFIKLCQDTLSNVIRTINNNKDTAPFNYHHMSIVCACYNAAYDYMIVPTESISGKAEYVISE